jgi:mRNA interferase MazF
MTTEPEFKRGEVYMGDPGPPVGHEQRGRRPFLVISINRMNRSPAGLAIVVPLTTTNRLSKLHVRVEPPEGGLDRISYAMPEMARSLSTLRLERRMGQTSRDIVETVANRVGLLIGLGRIR